MKASQRNRGIAVLFLSLGTRRTWVVTFLPWMLYPQGKNFWYTLNRKLIWGTVLAGRGGGNNIKKYNSLKRRVEFTAVMEKKVTLHPKFFLHQSVEQRNKTIFHSENVKCCLLKVTDVSQLWLTNPSSTPTEGTPLVMSQFHLWLWRTRTENTLKCENLKTLNIKPLLLSLLSYESS